MVLRLYTRNFLLKVKQKALRRKVWFKALDNLDRGFYNLVCAVVNKVRSKVLIRQVMAIVRRLREALKSDFIKLVESIGIKRSWEASELATYWGNTDALGWKRDVRFHKFHAMIAYNAPTRWSF